MDVVLFATSVVEPWGVAGLLVGLGVAVLRDRLDEDEQDVDDVEAARRAYESGEIDVQELSRRLDFALDERNEAIVAVVEDVEGVGPVTARAVARRFESVEQLRVATVDDLEDVHGVGPSTAAALRERVGN